MNKSFQERLKRDPVLREWYAKMPSGPLRKPKAQPVAIVPVSERLAEAAKANPESVNVRVSARASEGVVVVDPPRRAQIVEAEIRRAREERSAGQAVRRQQEAEAEGELRRMGANAEIEAVVEVDGEGRPKWATVRDRATNARGSAEFAGGYRRTGVMKDYDPMKRFEEGFGE
jgi:hypothetical protein